MQTARINKELEVFIAGVGATQSLLMAFYSFYERKKDYRNLLLCLFFVAITIRLAKSILWVYLDSTPIWVINFGFMAHAVSGPALFLYALHFLFPRKWSWFNLLHFLPGVLLLLSITTLSLDGFWYAGGYTSLLFHQISYSFLGLILLGVHFFSKRSTPLTRSHIIWILSLLIGTAVFQFLYFSNYILGITPYLLGPIIYLPFIYFLAFLLFKNPSLLKYNPSKKHQNIKLSERELNARVKQLNLLMQEQKLFLDPNCTLNKVGKALKLPSYLVSYIVNNGIGKSFPDFLNGYRIEEAKQKLLHPDYAHIKIANIAYDCGFNSLSSFNSFFKKTENTTPSKFRDNHS